MILEHERLRNRKGAAPFAGDRTGHFLLNPAERTQKAKVSQPKRQSGLQVLKTFYFYVTIVMLLNFVYSCIPVTFQ